MQQLTESKMKNIYGGKTTLTAAMVTAVIKGATFILDLGKAVGSAIRRYQLKSYC